MKTFALTAALLLGGAVALPQGIKDLKDQLSDPTVQDKFSASAGLGKRQANATLSAALPGANATGLDIDPIKEKLKGLTGEATGGLELGKGQANVSLSAALPKASAAGIDVGELKEKLEGIVGGATGGLGLGKRQADASLSAALPEASAAGIDIVDTKEKPEGLTGGATGGLGLDFGAVRDLLDNLGISLGDLGKRQADASLSAALPQASGDIGIDTIKDKLEETLGRATGGLLGKRQELPAGFNLGAVTDLLKKLGIPLGDLSKRQELPAGLDPVAVADLLEDLGIDLGKRQEGGATLGIFQAAINKVLGELKNKVPEIEGPADKLIQAISDFEDAAKDIDLPTPTA